MFGASQKGGEAKTLADAASRDAAVPAAPADKLATAPPDPWVGRLLAGRYLLGARLAKGGMGYVYTAKQVALDRAVAVKLLRPQGTPEKVAQFQGRFLTEAAAAAKLQHPHSVTVLDYGQNEDGSYFLVMELLRGQPLAALLLGRPLPPLRALGMALQVGRAVQAAHAAGIVHRDLKPENLMVLHWGEDAARHGDDFVKVLDFGLAKQFDEPDAALTRTGQHLGSPGYMAPEQVLGTPLDGRCDVYALGAILYEMLSGRAPFVRPSPHEVMRAHVQEALPPMGAPSAAPAGVWDGLEALVARAMKKDPADRFDSMQHMLAALHEAEHRVLAAKAAGHAWAQGAAVGPAGTEQNVALCPADAPRTSAAAGPPAAHAWLGVRQEMGTLVAATLAGHRPATAPAPAHTSRPALAAANEARLSGRSTLRAAGVAACLLMAGAALPRAGGWFCAALWAARPAAMRPALAAASPGPSAVLPGRCDARLHLDSLPRGAGVYLGGQCVCVATPCELTLADDAYGQRLQFRFALPEHDDFLLSKTLPSFSQAGQDPLHIFARMTPPVEAAAPRLVSGLATGSREKWPATPPAR